MAVSGFGLLACIASILRLVYTIDVLLDPTISAAAYTVGVIKVELCR